MVKFTGTPASVVTVTTCWSIVMFKIVGGIVVVSSYLVKLKHGVVFTTWNIFFDRVALVQFVCVADSNAPQVPHNAQILSTAEEQIAKLESTFSVISMHLEAQ